MEWLSTILKNFVKPLQWWIVIAPWEQGLRVRLGKTSKLLRPGIHFRIPFLDKIYVQNTRLRTIEESNTTATTTDGVAVTYSLAINLAVGDVSKLFQNLSSPKSTLVAAAQGAISRAIASGDKTSLDANSLEQAALVVVRQVAESAGFINVEVKITALCCIRAYRLINESYSSGADSHEGFAEMNGGVR